jgi:hypothetical protein
MSEDDLEGILREPIVVETGGFPTQSRDYRLYFLPVVEECCSRVGYTFDKVVDVVEEVLLSYFSACTYDAITSHIKVDDKKEDCLPNMVITAALEYLRDQGHAREIVLDNGESKYRSTMKRRLTTIRGLTGIFVDPDIPVDLEPRYARSPKLKD